MTNWLRAADYAACTDLSPVFYSRWGFPRPDGTVAPRPPASAVPEPRWSCSAVSVERVQRSRVRVNALVTCNAAVGGSCKLTLTMTVVERLRGRQPIAPTASKTTRVLTVGRAIGKLGVGDSRDFHLRLGAAGRRLLTSAHKLAVTLTITATSNGGHRRLVARRRITFRNP